MQNPLFRAAIDCPHTIEKDAVVLHFDSKKPGHNALNQLSLRLDAAADAPVTASGPFYVASSDNERGFLSISGAGAEIHPSIRHANVWPTYEEADDAANRAGLVCYAILQPAVGIPR